MIRVPFAVAFLAVQAPEPSPPAQSYTNAKDGLEYIVIAPGSFRLGCSPADSDCEADEKPVRTIRITKSFAIGKTEVTVSSYRTFAKSVKKEMPPTPHYNPGWLEADQPIVNIAWDEAQEFCNWAGGRLPTEAEWEYAARAGTTAARYGEPGEIGWYVANSGDNPIDAVKFHRQVYDNFKEFDATLKWNKNRARAVGQKTPNAWGLHDILGNAAEWTADWYALPDEIKGPTDDPQGPDAGEVRVVRGGSAYNFHHSLRLSNRSGSRPERSYDDLGFRCVGPSR